MLVAGLAAAWLISGTASAQSPTVYTSISVSDVTSGAPVVGLTFTTYVNVSVSNNGGGTPTPIQGVEVYVGYNPTTVGVVDYDNNPTNGTQVEIRSGFFTSIQTGVNRVETPCPAPSLQPACVHFALSQITGGVTNGAGTVAVIRWVGLAAGSAGMSVEVESTSPYRLSKLSDTDGMPVPVNTASAPGITIQSPGAITGAVTRQGRTSGNYSDASVSALSIDGAAIAGPVSTLADGTFASPLLVPAGGTYNVVATYPGYLAAQKSSVYVVGSTVNIGSTQLRGGDVNADNCVNIFDLVQIAVRFGSGGGTLASSDPWDINDDGYINIFDLTIAASNFQRCGPTTW
jgi:hypothetical protein